MHRVEPSVHLIAQTTINKGGLKTYLEQIGAPDWQSDAPSDVEEIIEVMSRGCYKSFGTDLNPNITRTRPENAGHLAHILESGHGSVLEHAWVSFEFTDVSRVFTHELVRHRPGVAISQESLRFVRLTDLGLWIPSCYRDNPAAVKVYERAWRQAEENYAELLSEKVLGENIDEDRFGRKKELTSAARRVSPIGLATGIGWSCNMRSMRHVLEMRTGPGAEEEIRLVFDQVGKLAKTIWPNIFVDFGRDESGAWKPKHHKV